MSKPSLRQRLRYWFDNLMGRGTGALLAVLGAAVLLFIAINTIVVLVLNVGPDGTGGERRPVEVVWNNVVRVLDTDDVAPQADLAFRLVMLLITIVGFFIAATLVGIITGGFSAKVEQLRKGRSAVLETDHTVILGWNSKIGSVVSSLCEANRSERRAAVVILADMDRVTMDDDIRAKVPDTFGTQVICRSGDLLDQDDLLRANPFASQSVILLSADEGDDADARSIKTALALSQHPARAGRPLHLVGHLHDAANLEAARLAGGPETQWLLADEKVGQITAQTSHQPGLSNVYTDLLSYGGTEIYFTRQPSLAGSAFGAAQHAFPNASLIGIERDGRVLLAPDPAEALREDDELIVLAEDDSAIALGEPGAPDPAVRPRPSKVTKPAGKTLVIGSNACLPQMLGELDAYSTRGSQVTVLSEYPVPQLPAYRNMKVTVMEGSALNRAVLDSVDPTSFDHAIVVAYHDRLSTQEADTKTLVTLLHLRDMIARSGKRISVVSEMLDERNRRLAEVTQIDDFIVSDYLVSLMMVQIAENPRMGEVFAELFSSAGSEIYLRPAPLYVKTGVPADFHSVCAGAQARGEAAMGYIAAAEGPGSPARVALNPVKAEPRVYAEGDLVIVLSLD